MCNRITTGAMWSAQEKKNHINVLEPLPIILAIQTFSKSVHEAKSHSFPGGQHGSFDIPVKDGGTQNLKLVQLAKEIWDHLLQCRITLTAGYLEERSLEKYKGRNSSPCPKKPFKISGMNGLRARLQKQGVSREASDLTIKSRR